MKRKIFTIMVCSSLFLSSCIGGGGGGSDSSTGSVDNSVSVEGSGVDDYIIGATVKIYKADGTLLETQGDCKTGALGKFKCYVNGIDNETPIVIVLEGGKEDVDGDPNTKNDQKTFEGSLVALSKAKNAVILNPVSTKVVADIYSVSVVIKDDSVYIPSDKAHLQIAKDKQI